MRGRRWYVWLGLIAVAGLALRIAYVPITKNPRAIGARATEEAQPSSVTAGVETRALRILRPS